jgi:glutathione synthase/RimK-type ligase-like ATP-grasp enzyme
MSLFDNKSISTKPRLKFSELLSRDSKISSENKKLFLFGSQKSPVLDKIKQYCDVNSISCFGFDIQSCHIKENKLYDRNNPIGIPLDGNNIAVFSADKSVYSSYIFCDLFKKLSAYKFDYINSFDVYDICSNKYKLFTMLTKNNISIPEFILINNQSDLVNDFATTDILIKRLKYPGIIIANSFEFLITSLRMLWSFNPNEELILQEYIKSNYYIKVFIFNKKIITAIKINSISGAGPDSSMGEYLVSDEISNLCMNISSLITGFIGVDIKIDKNNKLYVINVDSFPDISAVEKYITEDMVPELMVNILNHKKEDSGRKINGCVEIINIKDFGDIKAKLDTTNDAICSFNVDDIKMNESDHTVSFKYKGQNINKPYIKKVSIKRGNINNERAVIGLNVSFNDMLFEGVEFLLDNKFSLNNNIPIILDKKFMKKTNVLIDPSK